MGSTGERNTIPFLSLHILAYNMKRVMAVLGTKSLMEAMRA